MHNKSVNMKLSKEEFNSSDEKNRFKGLTVSVTMSIIAMASVIGVRS